MMPGELVNGITQERIRLANELAGWIEVRSRYAKIGFVIHVVARLVQPRCDNKKVLAGAMPLALYLSMRICEILVEELKGEAEHKG